MSSCRRFSSRARTASRTKNAPSSRTPAPASGTVGSATVDSSLLRLTRTLNMTRRWFALVVTMVLVPGAAHAQKVQLVPPDGDGGKHWPRWRGPAQGVVADGDYPDQWSPTENVLWKVKVPGQGNSSPIIWKDRLFLTAHENQGKTRLVLGFDRTDGKLLWQCPVPKHLVEGAQGKNGWA